MTLEINIDDYISEEEKKNIVINAYENAVYETLRRTDKYQLLANVGYDVVFKAVNEMLGEDSIQIISERVKKILSEFTSFEVFRDGTYGGKPSKGYLLLEEVVTENKELINSRVKNLITGMSDEDFKYKIQDMLNDEIHKAIFGEDE